MNSIVTIDNINSLIPYNLAILDDGNDGICLCMKSESKYQNVNFKFKKLQFHNTFLGILLLRLDYSYYHCFVSYRLSEHRRILNKLIDLSCFNFINFTSNDRYDIYRIQNNFSNTILMSTDADLETSTDIEEKKLLDTVLQNYTIEKLWTL